MYSLIGEGLNLVGHHAGQTPADAHKQIAIRNDRDPLLPGAVAGREMPVEVKLVSEQLPRGRQQFGLDRLGLLCRAAHEFFLVQQDFLPDNLVGPLIGYIQRPQHLCQLVGIGPGVEVGRRPLQHGDMPALAGHRGNQGRGGGTGAYYQHLHVAVIQIFGPQLGVHDPPLVAVHPRPLRGVRLVVVIVTLAHPQEARGKRQLLAALQVVYLQLPALCLAAPTGGADLVAIPDIVTQAVLLDTLGQVFQDFRGGGDGGADPGFPTVTEGVQIAV